MMGPFSRSGSRAHGLLIGLDPIEDCSFEGVHKFLLEESGGEGCGETLLKPLWALWRLG